MVVAGIDEAGLGPKLGPLVVSATVFRSPEGVSGHEFWQHFREGISASRSRGDGRLQVADSKVVYQAGRGFDRLEETALTFLALAQGRAHSLARLLEVLSPGTGKLLGKYPWYENGNLDLPLSGRALGSVGKAGALKELFRKCGFSYLGARSEVMPAQDLNHMIGRYGNKSAALFECTARLLRRLFRRFARGGLTIVADRHGYRRRYQLMLAKALKGWSVRLLTEEEKLSSYVLRYGAREVQVSFLEDADARCFPVSLASMYSKYVRELFMKLLNQYWGELVPGLKPTAGYGRDARRFLKDVEPARRAEGIPATLLVRVR